VVRAGLLLFFKDDPARQQMGVATLPQGAVPLQGCQAVMPRDFRRSFSNHDQAHSGTSPGYEMKLTHRCAALHCCSF
jgi:hypothetical protein